MALDALCIFTNKPLIFEVNQGSLLLSTKELNTQEGDWMSVGKVRVAVTLEQMELAGPDRT